MSRPFPALSRRGRLRAIAAGGALTGSVVVAGCGTGTQAQPSGPGGPAAPATLVMIIRHGEKPDPSSPLPGVDINGNPAGNNSLTEVG